jgi:hypothetical protein
VADPRIDARRPRREAIVEVTFADGTQMNEWVRDVRGTAENPMPREEVVAKARDLIAPVLGGASCAALIDKVLALENVKEIRELRPLLQRGGRAGLVLMASCTPCRANAGKFQSRSER